MALRRGDLVTLALQGDSGKPRPALVIQADEFADLGSVVTQPLTSTLIDAPLLRVTIEPTPANGLGAPSQVMVDKPVSVRTDKLGAPFGRLDEATLIRISRSLVLVPALAG